MILVTGGTGYIGRHLVNALVRRADPVRALVRNPARATLPAEVQAVAGRLEDAASVAQAVTGVRAVVHLAAVTSATATDEQSLIATNADGTAALSQAARQAGVEHVVYVSSAGVYGIRDTREPITEQETPKPDTAYQRAKLAGEDAVRAHAPSWTILRPSDVFGPARRQTTAFVDRVRNRRFWLHTGTMTLENPAYVHDVVAAILVALDSTRTRGEAINVAGPRVLTHRQVIDAIAATLGHRLRHMTVPRSIVGSVSAASAGVYGLTGRSMPPRLALLRRAVINRGVSTEKARSFGMPTTPYEQAMADVIAADVASRADAARTPA